MYSESVVYMVQFAMIQFQVLLQRLDEFSSVKQAGTLFESVTHLFGPDGLNFIAKDGSLEVDEVICFLCYLTLKNISKLVLNNLLHILLKAAQTELEKLCLPRCDLSFIFAAFPESVSKAITITQSWRPQLKATELHEDENIVLRPESQPAVTALYINRSPLFSSAA